MKIGVDKIYVINLKKHKERKIEIIKFLDTIDTPYEIIEAIDGLEMRCTTEFLQKNLHKHFFDPGGIVTRGVLGCALSHHKAWKKFMDDGLETALIFEDDVRATDEFFEWVENKKLEKATNDLKTKNWGVCFFGKTRPDIDTTEDVTSELGVYKGFSNTTWCAHSYVINKHSVKWMYANLLPLNRAVDVFLECVPFRVLTLKKSLFVQKHMLYKKPYNDENLWGAIPEEYKPSTMMPYHFTTPHDINHYEISDDKFKGLVTDPLIEFTGIEEIKLKVKGVEFPVLKMYLKL